MEVTPNAATLLFTQFDQPAACSLELLGEADCMSRGCHLRSEVGDQTAVGITQLFARPR